MNQSFEEILHHAHRAAHEAVKDLPDTGACGFAWVTIEGRSPLARHCRLKAANDMPGRRFYGSKGFPRGWQFWKPGGYPGQSIDAIEAGARAFRDVLAEYGIRADVGSRLD